MTREQVEAALEGAYEYLVAEGLIEASWLDPLSNTRKGSTLAEFQQAVMERLPA